VCVGVSACVKTGISIISLKGKTLLAFVIECWSFLLPFGSWKLAVVSWYFDYD